MNTGLYRAPSCTKLSPAVRPAPPALALALSLALAARAQPPTKAETAKEWVYSEQFLQHCQSKDDELRLACTAYVRAVYDLVHAFSMPELNGLKMPPICLPGGLTISGAIDESVVPFLLKMKREGGDLSTRNPAFDVYLALQKSYPCAQEPARESATPK